MTAMPLCKGHHSVRHKWPFHEGLQDTSRWSARGNLIKADLLCAAHLRRLFNSGKSSSRL